MADTTETAGTTETAATEATGAAGETGESQPETGWEDHVPVGDSLLRRYVVNHEAWFEALAHAAGGRTETTEAWSGADLGRPAGFLNSVALRRPPVWEEFDATLDEVEAWFGGGPGFLWSAWPTADLRRRGWELVGYPPLLVRFPGGSLPPARSDLRVEQVVDERGLRDWERVLADGFPLEDLQGSGPLLERSIVDDTRVSMWVAYDGASPLAMGTSFREAGVAQLALAATLPEARRRGSWYSLVRARLEEAGDLPAAGLLSDDSRPGAERVGFVPLQRFVCWHWPG